MGFRESIPFDNVPQQLGKFGRRLGLAPSGDGRKGPPDHLVQCLPMVQQGRARLEQVEPLLAEEQLQIYRTCVLEMVAARVGDRALDTHLARIQQGCEPGDCLFRQMANLVKIPVFHPDGMPVMDIVRLPLKVDLLPRPDGRLIILQADNAAFDLSQKTLFHLV